MNGFHRALRLFTLICLVMSFHAAEAQVYYNPQGIVILPSPPIAGQEFVVRWDAPDCVSIGELREVIRSGSHLQVAVEYIEPLPGLPSCTGATRRHEWSVGPFPAGAYEFELTGIDPMFNDSSGTIAQFPLTILPYAASAPNVVPSGTPTGWALLSLMLGLGAMIALRPRSA
jgi:hypothetical protein